MLSWATFKRGQVQRSIVFFQTAIIIVLLLFTLTLIVTMSSARERPLKHPSSPPTIGSVLKTKNLGFVDTGSMSSSEDEDEEIGLIGGRRKHSDIEVQKLMSSSATQKARRTSKSCSKSIQQQLSGSIRPSFVFVVIAKVHIEFIS